MRVSADVRHSPWRRSRRLVCQEEGQKVHAPVAVVGTVIVLAALAGCAGMEFGESTRVPDTELNGIRYHPPASYVLIKFKL